jgi:hypothetical protein
VFDQLSIWNGQLSASDVAALPAAQNTETPTSREVTNEFPSGWSTGPVVTVGSGFSSGYSNTPSQHNTLYDGREHDSNVLPGSQENPSASASVMAGSSGASIYWYGGFHKMNHNPDVAHEDFYHGSVAVSGVPL